MRLEASKRALHQLPRTEVNLKGTLGTTLPSSKQKEGKKSSGEKHQDGPEGFYVHQAGLALKNRRRGPMTYITVWSLFLNGSERLPKGHVF